MNHTMILAATSSRSANIGATVLLLMLFTGIFVGLRSKKLTITELLVCGTFGLLLGATGLGNALQGPLSTLGSHLLTWVG